VQPPRYDHLSGRFDKRRIEAAACSGEHGNTMDISSFYNHPVILRRMMEYTGDGCFIMPTENATAGHFTPASTDRLGAFLANGADLSRSLRDRSALIAHLDMEYGNCDFPAEPYADRRHSGGSISSTATTASFSRQSRRDASGAAVSALVILVASTVVFFRVALVGGMLIILFWPGGEGLPWVVGNG